MKAKNPQLSINEIRDICEDICKTDILWTIYPEVNGMIEESKIEFLVQRYIGYIMKDLYGNRFMTSGDYLQKFRVFSYCFQVLMVHELELNVIEEDIHSLRNQVESKIF